jgi:pimeloyl-ACP methyl ester carboxylesterase
MRRAARVVLAACVVTIASDAAAASQCESLVPKGTNIPGWVGTDKGAVVIVFVHGIDGDGYSTWCNETEKKYWPLLLKGDPRFDKSAVYVAQYDTSLINDTIPLPKIADNMIVQLTPIYELGRPVIFVVHSQGGLLVRSILLRKKEWAERTPAIAFFSTPTLGSSWAYASSIVPWNRQGQDLKPVDVNSFLDEQQRSWKAANYPIASYCSAETKAPSFIGRVWGRILGSIVSVSSAEAGGCTGPTVFIDGDHFDVVKPAARLASQQNDALTRVLRHVQSCLEYQQSKKATDRTVACNNETELGFYWKVDITEPPLAPWGFWGRAGSGNFPACNSKSVGRLAVGETAIIPGRDWDPVMSGYSPQKKEHDKEYFPNYGRHMNLSFDGSESATTVAASCNGASRLDPRPCGIYPAVCTRIGANY